MKNEKNIIKSVINYSYDKKPKVCTYCRRLNHNENTHCWYCNKDFTK